MSEAKKKAVEKLVENNKKRAEQRKLDKEQGKPVKPTLISLKEKKEFETQINTLEEANKQLLARLEKLEKFALGDLKSKDLAVYKIK